MDMKKVYLFFVMLCVPMLSMAQVQATGVTVNNWDGSALGSGEPLMLEVGQTRTLHLTLTPEDADLSTVSLGIEMTQEDQETGHMPIAFYGFDIVARTVAARTLYISNSTTKETLAMVKVVATDFLRSGPLYADVTEGQVWYSVSKSYKLQFWSEQLGYDRSPYTYNTYAIPDYDDSSSAPWYEFAHQITSVELKNIDRVGNNALNDLTQVRYISLPDHMTHLGNYSFLGCTNLKTIEVNRYDEADDFPMTIATGTSLIIDESEPDDPRRVSVIVVRPQEENALSWYRTADNEWGMCTVVPAGGTDNETAVNWSLGSSSSQNALVLSITPDPESEEPMSIGDRTDDTQYAWDDLSDAIENISIRDIAYVGSGAFDYLYMLESIRFTQSATEDGGHAIESINALAFSSDMQLKKFSFGNPNDGALTPPTVMSGEDMEQADVQALWENMFSDQTVLSVPHADSEIYGKSVADLYREDPIWGTCFNRIDDHTISTEQVASHSMVIKWLPQEDARIYRITIRMLDCDKEKCDTTIDIPATGPWGILDPERMSLIKTEPEGIVAARAPKSDDGSGGLTLTIDISGGEVHNQDISVAVSNLSSSTGYILTREVIMGNGTSNYELDDNTFVMTPASGEGIEDVTVNGEPLFYDLLGRSMGRSLDRLPDGIYIMDKGGVRSTILLRR